MIVDVFLCAIKNRSIEAAIGMSYRKFGDLVPVFAASDELALQERVEAVEVARLQESDPCGALDSPEKRLFFILYYLRSNPSFDTLGALFDLSPSHAYDQMIRCVRVLRRGLEILAVSPSRSLDSADELRHALERFAKASNDDVESDPARPVCDVPRDGQFVGHGKPAAFSQAFDTDDHWRSSTFGGLPKPRRAS